MCDHTHAQFSTHRFFKCLREAEIHRNVYSTLTIYNLNCEHVCNNVTQFNF